MKRTLKIAKAELQTLFYSPVAWMVLIIFIFQVCLNFFDLLHPYLISVEEGYSTNHISISILAGERSGLFTVLQRYLFLYVPLMTMGLISREFSSGSIKLLYSAPLTNKQIVWGKFIAIATFGLVMLSILWVLLVFASCIIVNFEYPVMLSGILGLMLLMFAYMAIGLFISSLTQYQVVAAIGSVTVFAILSAVGNVGQDIEFVRDLTWWLSIRGRAAEMVSGLICSEDVIYFIVLILLFISLTILRLNNVRQKTPRDKSLANYFGVTLLAFAIGYISARPQFMFFYDTTHTKECTITEGSQEIMSLLKGNVTMTTYVNTIGRYNYMLPPRSINSDLKRYKQFRRFSPQIKIKYKYFYDTPESIRHEQLYDIKPDAKSLEDFNRYMSRIFKIDTNIVLRPIEIQNTIDLKPEYNRMVTHIVHESGKSTFLRVFDDSYVLPKEAEISAAFKRIVSDIQKVAFIEGHEERSIYNMSDSHYEYFSSDKRFRSSLINNGFDVCTHKLDNPIPDDISIIVLADPREKLNEIESQNLQKFIDRGGNLLITGEPHRIDIFNSLVENFGVKARPGLIVKDSKSVQADIILAKITKPATKMFYKFDNMYYYKTSVSMPKVAALEYTEDKGFKVMPLLTSDSDQTWLEYQTTDFVEDTVKYNPELGDIAGTFPTALSLSRQVNDKEQRIVVISDADCLSNAEIFNNRPGRRIANNVFLEGIFYYLSGDEVPVNMFRPRPIDYTIRIGMTGFEIAKIFILWGIPVIIAIFGTILWIRRRGK